MRPLLLLCFALAILPVAAAQFPEPGEPFYMLHMQDYEYLPDPIEVPPGTTVYAMNFGQEPHTVTDVADPPRFNVVNIQPGGEAYTFVAPTEPGEYPYYCIYHGDRAGNGMVGTLKVVANVTTATPTPTATTPTPTATPTPSATPAGTTPASTNDAPLPVWVLILGVAAAAWRPRSR